MTVPFTFCALCWGQKYILAPLIDAKTGKCVRWYKETCTECFGQGGLTV